MKKTARGTLPFWLFAFFLFCFSAAGQGPFDGFLKGKGQLDAAVSASFSSAKRFVGAAGSNHDFGFRGQALSLFAEGGLTRNLDAIFTLPVVFSDRQRGLQDAGLYLKMRPFHAKINQKGSKISILTASGLSFPVGKYEPTAAGALGQRAVEWPLKVLFQFESSTGFFALVAAGKHFRLDKLSADDIASAQAQRPDFEPSGPADFQTFLGKIGFAATHFYVDGWMERQWTIGGSDFQPGVFDLPQTFGVSFLQAGVTAFYTEKPERNGFFISVGRILSGRNVSKISRLSLGCVRKFGNVKTKSN